MNIERARLTSEDIHNMEQLIISAMTNEEEYPVDNVGEHATEIAKILIFNGYGLLTKAIEIWEKDERKLRDLLFAGHACDGKYYDDGELQCNGFLPPIDFLRDTPREIERKVPLHYAQLAESKKDRLDRPELRRKLENALDEYVGFPPDDVPKWVDWDLALDEILSFYPDEPEIRKDERLKVVEEIKELCYPLTLISSANKGIALTFQDLEALKERE